MLPKVFFEDIEFKNFSLVYIDLATLSLSGVGIFFLARDPFGQQIAQIPFFTIIELNIGMENGKKNF